MAHELKPIEKAKQLVKEYLPMVFGNNNDVELFNAKNCATIVVDNLIEEHNFKSPINWNKQRTKYWEDVKLEISKFEVVA